MSDAEMETIITSAINRAVAQEREECAFMANGEAYTITGTSDMELGQAAAYNDMAMRIRDRSHANTETTRPA